MTRIIEIGDGVMRRRVEIDSDGKARSQLQQPTRGAILDRNAELRKNRGAVRNGSAMGLEYTIPLADLYTIQRAIRRNNPGAGSKDQAGLLRSWLEKYGQIYKVR